MRFFSICARLGSRVLCSLHNLQVDLCLIIFRDVNKTLTLCSNTLQTSDLQVQIHIFGIAQLMKTWMPIPSSSLSSGSDCANKLTSQAEAMKRTCNLSKRETNRDFVPDFYAAG